MSWVRVQIVQVFEEGSISKIQHCIGFDQDFLLLGGYLKKIPSVCVEMCVRECSLQKQRKMDAFF